MMLAAGRGRPRRGQRPRRARRPRGPGRRRPSGSPGARRSGSPLDDTLFTGSATGPWADDIPGLGFAAPVAAVAVDTGAAQPRASTRRAPPTRRMAAAQRLRRGPRPARRHGRGRADPRDVGRRRHGRSASVDSAPARPGGRVLPAHLGQHDHRGGRPARRDRGRAARRPSAGATQAVAQQLEQAGRRHRGAARSPTRAGSATGPGPRRPRSSSCSP